MKIKWTKYKLLASVSVLLILVAFDILFKFDINPAREDKPTIAADCRTFLLKASSDADKTIKILLPEKLSPKEHQGKIRLLEGSTLVVEETDAVIESEVATLEIHQEPLHFDTVELLLSDNTYRKIAVGKHSVEWLPEPLTKFDPEDAWYAVDGYTKTEVNRVIGSFTFKTGTKAMPELIFPVELIDEEIIVSTLFKEKKKQGDRVTYDFEIITKKPAKKSSSYNRILFDAYIVYNDIKSNQSGFLMKVNIPLDVQ